MVLWAVRENGSQGGLPSAVRVLLANAQQATARSTGKRVVSTAGTGLLLRAVATVVKGVADSIAV